MKTIIFFLVIALIGCGSQDPFSRGKNSSSDSNSSNQVGQKPIRLDAELFQTAVQPLTKKDCSGCHSNPAENLEQAKSKIVLGKPEESKLWLFAVGIGHTKRWDKTSAEAVLLASWINGAAAAQNPPPAQPPAPPQEEQPVPVNPPAEEGPEGFYSSAVKPLIEKSCTRCHEGREQYAEAKSLIVPGQPEKSELFNKASGLGHRKIWAKDSQQLAVLKKWIELEK